MPSSLARLSEHATRLVKVEMPALAQLPQFGATGIRVPLERFVTFHATETEFRPMNGSRRLLQASRRSMTDTKDVFQEHDRLFHAVFSSKERAAELIRSLLPDALGRQIDFSTIEPRPSKYTGAHLEGRHSDALFEVKVGGREALIYVLLEHQSRDEPFMVVRVLLYMALIWDGMRREETRPRYLPPIVPVVVHHGESGWNAATCFEELIDPAARDLEGLSVYIPRFELILDDLSRASDGELKARGLAALSSLALWALRDVRNPERFFRHLGAWADLLNELAENPETASGAALLMRYITHVLGNDRTEQLRDQLSALAPAAEQTMLSIAQSIAEAFEQKGLEKGLEKGRKEGRKEGLEKGRIEERRTLVTRQLAKKFGPLPETAVARLQAATVDELTGYADRLLDAGSLDEVFGG
jgi:predicted transposase/invertase (TIGR01784 family)